MRPPALELSYIQVGLAALLILINGGISVLLSLNLGRQLLGPPSPPWSSSCSSGSYWSGSSG